MRALHITLKDLTQIFADRKSLFFLLIMPVIFTAFMGFVLGLGGNNGDNQDTQYTIGLYSPGNDRVLNQALTEAIENQGLARVVPVGSTNRTESEEKVRSGELAGVILLPVDAYKLVLSGETPRIDIILAEDSAAGQALKPVILRSLERILSAGKIANLTSPDLAGKEAAFQTAWKAWQQPLFSLDAEKAVAAQGDQGSDVFENPYNQSSPGMIVMFSIFGLTTSSLALVQERKSGALQRLMSTSVSRGQIIAGHLMAMFTVVLIQAVLLVVAGQLMFGVDYLRQPLAIFLVIAALAFWVSAMGMLIGLIAKSDEQATMIAMGAMFLFAALGGTWFPLEITGQTFATVGKLLPSGWAMTALQNILVRGLDLPSVLPALAVIAGFGLVFFGAAVWFFNTMTE